MAGDGRQRFRPLTVPSLRHPPAGPAGSARSRPDRLSPVNARAATLRGRAPVAQLDRASVYGTEGQRFESSRARSGRPFGFAAATPDALNQRRLRADCSPWLLAVAEFED